MSLFLGILSAVLIFGLIIVFHEFGHFIVARMNGIAVPEFNIGFGPKIFSFKKGGTEFVIRPILLGGGCNMLGMDGGTTTEDSFFAKKPGVRFATIFAGPLFNFILAFVLAMVIIGIVGYDPCIVTYVDEGGAAEAAGLQVGDEITGYGRERIHMGRELSIYEYFNPTDSDSIRVEYVREGEKHTTVINPEEHRSLMLGFYYTADDSPFVIDSIIEGGVFERAGLMSGDRICSFNGKEISTGIEFQEYVNSFPLQEEEVEVVVERKNTRKTLTLMPEYKLFYETGFSYNYVGRVKASPLQVIKYSFFEVRYYILSTVRSIGTLFTGKFSKNDVGGPVRIVSELENTIEKSSPDGPLYVFLNLLNWSILLSVNLGIINLLPLPALDGGRLFFIFVELIRRKPIPPEKEGLVHGIGMVLLLVLIVFIFFNDIKTIFFF